MRSEPSCSDDDRACDHFIEDCGGHAPFHVSHAEPAHPAHRVFGEGRAIVNGTIEREIIPRLLLAHRARALPPSVNPTRPTGADVEAFATLLLSDDEEAAGRFLHRVSARGVPLESVLLDLVAPAARRLGEMWSLDLCTFIDVTLGVYRLQKLLGDVSRLADLDDPALPDGARVLLVPAPGEQHTFGILVVEEFLRRAGFDVWTHLACDGASTLELLSRTTFDAIGISVGRPESVDATRRFVLKARRASLTNRLFVIAGGSALSDGSFDAAALGCDAIAKDVESAVETLRGSLGESVGLTHVVRSAALSQPAAR
jgi:methanogenic corrinoid protein MtbC1